MGSVPPLRRLPHPLCIPAKPPLELRMLLTRHQQPGLKMSSLFLLFGVVFFSENAMPLNRFHIFLCNSF